MGTRSHITRVSGGTGIKCVLDDETDTFHDERFEHVVQT